MNNKITIGSDPEVFFEKEGVVRSAIGMIEGSKYNPFPITEKGHMIQLDNVAFEYNIPPCENEEDWVKNIIFVREHLRGVAILNGGDLSTKASAELPNEDLEHPDAQMFGCDPDYNVWSRSMNEPPEVGENLRSCGGHVSIGYPNPTQEMSEKMIKAFDVYLGLPSLFEDPDTERRKLYGKAGCFRLPEYGFEYRTLSNYWIHKEEYIRQIYRRAMYATNLVLSGDFNENDWDGVEEIINTNDKEKAKELLEKINVLTTI